jgi:hypothetical protein
MKFQKAYEYEGQGQRKQRHHDATSKIKGMFESDIGDYRSKDPKGTLGPKFFREAAILLGQAFDIAISTENLKNKDKQ